MNLSEATLEKIDALIPRYPDKRSATLPLLHLVQEDQGWISKEAMEWIAARLDLTPMNVYEVVSFYPMYKTAPIGRKHVKVCRTLPCALRGSYRTCDELAELLQCPVGGTSEDGEFTLDFVECIACCGGAPVVQVNDKMYENITPESVAEFVEQLREGKDPAEEEKQRSIKGTPEFKG